MYQQNTKPDLNDRIDMTIDWLWIGATGMVFRTLLAVRKPKVLSGTGRDRLKR